RSRWPFRCLWLLDSANRVFEDAATHRISAHTECNSLPQSDPANPVSYFAVSQEARVRRKRAGQAALQKLAGSAQMRAVGFFPWSAETAAFWKRCRVSDRNR